MYPKIAAYNIIFYFFLYILNLLATPSPPKNLKAGTVKKTATKNSFPAHPCQDANLLGSDNLSKRF